MLPVFDITVSWDCHIYSCSLFNSYSTTHVWLQLLVRLELEFPQDLGCVALQLFGF